MEALHMALRVKMIELYETLISSQVIGLGPELKEL